MSLEDLVAKVVAKLRESGELQGRAAPQSKSRADIQRELHQKLGPEYISTRSGGGSSKVAYLEGHTAIGLANEIFGYDGWSSEIRERKVEYPVDKSGRTCCSVLLRVTLPNGMFREDIGYGTVMKGTHVVQDIEKAGKEACTDALKRVLRQFGEPLGNCLYDKEYIKQIRHVPPRKYDIDIDSLRRPPMKRKHEEMEASVTKDLKGSTVGNGSTSAKESIANGSTVPYGSTNTPATNTSTSKPVAKSLSMAPPKIQPVAESTPKDAPGPPTDFILSSSPPDLPVPRAAPKPTPLPKLAPELGPDSDSETESRPQQKPETPGLVSGATIEKFDQTNEWTDISYDASISLRPGCVIDQSASKPVLRNTTK